MSEPLSRFERAVWVASWVAPLARWAVFIAFGLVVAWPALRSDPWLAAWVIVGLVVIGFLAHFLVWHHGTRAEHFNEQERAHLSGRLLRAGGHGDWRALMRKYQRTWYRGRSHSGERPRYD